MRKIATLALILALAFILTGCAPGPNESKGTPAAAGRPAGFWLGLWHGLISPITFIVSLFSAKVNFYEVHNTGSWYNFGFVLGAGLFLGGGIFGRRRKR